jgi:hypothetical protein
VSVARHAFFFLWAMIGVILLCHYYNSYVFGHPLLAWTYDGTPHAVFLTGGK